MKKTILLKLAVAFVVGTLLSSCAITKIQSNKAEDFNEKVHKVFITVRGSDGSKPYMKKLINSLRDELQTANIESSEYFFDPLSLETSKEIEKQIADYGPDVVMTINQTEMRATANPYGWGSAQTGATLDIKLFKRNSEKPIWRASLKADGQYGLNTTSLKSAKKIVAKLSEDGLI
jgi:predicted  nucleic acid-binding Zn-ribbon protein